MAFIQCDFQSEVLGISASMNVLLPQGVNGGSTGNGPGNGSGNGKYPVLYLLHGLSDDHTAWMRRTSIERYAEPYGLAVVMPAVNRSFYADMVHGYRYWTFISEELPVIARSLFPLSSRMEDTFAAGLSMGGYGAFKLALRCPDRFAAAASLSGAVDIASRVVAENAEDLRLVFGDTSSLAGSEDDLMFLAGKLAASGGQVPRLFQCCGTEDFLYEDNLRFRDFCRSISLDLTYEDEPGIHDWAYWDKKIQRVLEWLPLNKRTVL